VKVLDYGSFDFKTLLKYKWKTYNEKRNEKKKTLFFNVHI